MGDERMNITCLQWGHAVCCTLEHVPLAEGLSVEGPPALKVKISTVSDLVLMPEFV